MVLLEQTKYELGQYEQPLKEMEAGLNRPLKNEKIAEIEKLMEIWIIWRFANYSS